MIIYVVHSLVNLAWVVWCCCNLLRYVDAAAVPEAKVRTEHARTFTPYLVGTHLSLHSLPLGWNMAEKWGTAHEKSLENPEGGRVDLWGTGFVVIRHGRSLNSEFSGKIMDMYMGIFQPCLIGGWYFHVVKWDLEYVPYNETNQLEIVFFGTHIFRLAMCCCMNQP